MLQKPRTIIKLAFRKNDTFIPDHHLWSNHGTYCIAYTLHYSDRTADRLRYSLKTKDLTVAKSRRDAILEEILRVCNQIVPAYRSSAEVEQTCFPQIEAA